MDLPVRKSSELHGPRPATLKVCKDSHTIVKKPPANAPRPPRRRPVVIYISSPKVVHATPAEFRSVVQRLTGLSASSSSSSSSSSSASRKTAAVAKPSTSEEVLAQIAGGGSVALLPPATTSPAVLHENSSFFFESASSNLFSPVASYWEHYLY
ncbi:uncharacterized protein LOC141816219 [Curcuma longa]|uniref:uncharacterized protein LOC141816219 n=1 Tax=Curcuma longa TaxID=136217 RepID=UPI003D9EA61A